MEESLRMEENFEKEKSLKKETTAGMEDSLRMIADSFPLDAQKVRTYSALSFAYIGDSVYDLIIRTMITTRGNTKPKKAQANRRPPRGGLAPHFYADFK